MPATTLEAVMQMRRGLEEDLDIEQLRVGEWALSTDTKWVRICYAQGKVIKIASQEAMDATLAEIQEIEDQILIMKNAAAASALAASGSATSAEGSAEDAEAWAVGKRDGVDVPSTDPAYHNNAKYWAQNSTIPTGGTTGQVLAKKSNSDRDTEWVNQSGGASTLSGLTDTNISNPSNDQVLKYNGTSGKWENSQGESGGHTIENSAGTSMTQRDTLQFKGTLKVSDDSTNEKTVVSDEAEEIEWSVWSAMTESEQNAYSAGKKLDILHAPSVPDNRAPKTDIATVESGSTASRAYSVGELVYVNGDLYKVITAIASGATFTVGTNIQSTNVSDAVNQFSTVKSRTILGSLGAKQYGKVVSINGYAKIDSISANTDLTIGNIGDLIPPNDAIRGMCVLCQNAYDSTGDVAYFVVGTNGSVSIRTATARTNWYVRASVTYIAS